MSHPPVAALTSVHLYNALLLVPYGPLAEGLADCCPACQAACQPVAVAAESNGEDYDRHYGAYFCTYCGFRWLCFWARSMVDRLVQEALAREAAYDGPSCPPPPPVKAADDLLTYKEVAAMLGLSVKSIQRMVKFGVPGSHPREPLPHIKIGRAVRFHRKDIEPLIENRRYAYMLPRRR